MGQIIYGNSQRTPQDVHLAKEPSEIGDSLSIHLAQEPGSAAVWTLEVRVHVQQGSFILGTVQTIPPTVSGNGARTVVIAACPGATGWHVVATCPTEGEQAELTLDSSHCCASVAGVQNLEHPPTPSSADVTIVGPPQLINPWSNIWSIALANTFIIKGSAGRLRNVTLRVDSTLAAGTYYLQVWDAPIVPVDGTAVSLANAIDAPLKIVHVFGVDDLIIKDFEELGVEFDFGACLCLSSTEFTKTLVAGNFCSVIGAEYR